MFEKISAGAHHPMASRTRIAPDHHDRKRWRLPIVHQRAGQSGRSAAPARTRRGMRYRSKMPALSSLDKNGLVRKGVGDATTLARKRIDDENCFGHEPSRASLTAVEGDTVIAAPDLTDVKGHAGQDDLRRGNEQYEVLRRTLIVVPAAASGVQSFCCSTTSRMSSASEWTRSFSMMWLRCSSTVR